MEVRVAAEESKEVEKSGRAEGKSRSIVDGMSNSPEWKNWRCILRRGEKRGGRQLEEGTQGDKRKSVKRQAGCFSFHDAGDSWEHGNGCDRQRNKLSPRVKITKLNCR